jgi:hypothetical protein
MPVARIPMGATPLLSTRASDTLLPRQRADILVLDANALGYPKHEKNAAIWRAATPIMPITVKKATEDVAISLLT